MLAENQVQLIQNKTEQSLRIVQRLWDERIRVLDEYFNHRKGIVFFFVRKRPATQERLATILQQLERVNRRERQVVTILATGSQRALEILQDIELSSSQEAMLTADVSVEFRDAYADIKRMIGHCQDVLVFQESFLKKEAELLAHPDDRHWSEYVAEMQVVANKMRAVADEHKRLEKTRLFLQRTQGAILACRTAVEKKGPAAHIEPSIYSAITRVFAANIVSLLVMRPFDLNPRDSFWVFTSITATLVFFINFGDYYYNWFTWMTARMVSIRKSVAQSLAQR